MFKASTKLQSPAEPIPEGSDDGRAAGPANKIDNNSGYIFKKEKTMCRSSSWGEEMAAWGHPGMTSAGSSHAAGAMQPVPGPCGH